MKIQIRWPQSTQVQPEAVRPTVEGEFTLQTGEKSDGGRALFTMTFETENVPQAMTTLFLLEQRLIQNNVKGETLVNWRGQWEDPKWLISDLWRKNKALEAAVKRVMAKIRANRPIFFRRKVFSEIERDLFNVLRGRKP